MTAEQERKPKATGFQINRYTLTDHSTHEPLITRPKTGLLYNARIPFFSVYAKMKGQWADLTAFTVYAATCWLANARRSTTIPLDWKSLMRVSGVTRKTRLVECIDMLERDFYVYTSNEGLLTLLHKETGWDITDAKQELRARIVAEAQHFAGYYSQDDIEKVLRELLGQRVAPTRSTRMEHFHWSAHSVLARPQYIGLKKTCVLNPKTYSFACHLCKRSGSLLRFLMDVKPCRRDEAVGLLDRVTDRPHPRFKSVDEAEDIDAATKFVRTFLHRTEGAQVT